jgi:hypothetical protein
MPTVKVSWITENFEIDYYFRIGFYVSRLRRRARVPKLVISHRIRKISEIPRRADGVEEFPKILFWFLLFIGFTTEARIRSVKTVHIIIAVLWHHVRRGFKGENVISDSYRLCNRVFKTTEPDLELVKKRKWQMYSVDHFQILARPVT